MGILETVKDAVEVVQKADNIDLLRQLLNIHNDAIKLVEENGSLKSKIQSLEEQLKIRDALVFEDNVYWLQKETGKDGPYCSLCWDDKQKLVRLQTGSSHWMCILHKLNIKIPGSPDSTVRIVRG
jgi:hypothetical protein